MAGVSIRDLDRAARRADQNEVDVSALGWLPPEPEWSPTNAEYHAASDWWGSTMLKTFRQSPGIAYRRFIVRDMDPEPPSPALILGSLVHVALLEPETYDEQVVVVQVAGKAAKAFKTARDDPANADRLVVIAPEHDAAQGIADAVRNPQTEAAHIARALLLDGDGCSEYSYRWIDELGVKCKVRFDRLAETAKGPCSVNLKTSRAPATAPFSRAAFDLGYHAQQAFYERGFAHMASGVLLPSSLLVVVHNEPPYEVSIKQPSDEFLELGRRQIKADLSTLCDALATPDRGCWSASWENGIETLDLPPWARLKPISGTVVDTF